MKIYLPFVRNFLLNVLLFIPIVAQFLLLRFSNTTMHLSHSRGLSLLSRCILYQRRSAFIEHELRLLVQVANTNRQHTTDVRRTILSLRGIAPCTRYIHTRYTRKVA